MLLLVHLAVSIVDPELGQVLRAELASSAPLEPQAQFRMHSLVLLVRAVQPERTRKSGLHLVHRVPPEQAR